MTGDPTPPAEPRLKPMTLALAATAVILAGTLPAAFAQLPPEAQPWNLSVIGALSLFAAARLGFWYAVGLLAVAIMAKDTAIYLIHGWEPYPLAWVWFSVYAAIGWAFLRRTESPVRIGAAALSASAFFFVASNFVSWLMQALPYGYSLAGLADCYTAAIPFYRGTLIGDVAFTGVLFGAHAVLSQAYFPAERTATIPVEDRV